MCLAVPVWGVLSEPGEEWRPACSVVGRRQRVQRGDQLTEHRGHREALLTRHRWVDRGQRDALHAGHPEVGPAIELTVCDDLWSLHGEAPRDEAQRLSFVVLLRLKARRGHLEEVPLALDHDIRA